MFIFNKHRFGILAAFLGFVAATSSFGSGFDCSFKADGPPSDQAQGLRAAVYSRAISRLDLAVKVAADLNKPGGTEGYSVDLTPYIFDFGSALEKAKQLATQTAPTRPLPTGPITPSTLLETIALVLDSAPNDKALRPALELALARTLVKAVQSTHFDPGADTQLKPALLYELNEAINLLLPNNANSAILRGFYPFPGAPLEKSLLYAQINTENGVFTVYKPELNSVWNILKTRLNPK